MRNSISPTTVARRKAEAAIAREALQARKAAEEREAEERAAEIAAWNAQPLEIRLTELTQELEAAKANKSRLEVDLRAMNYNFDRKSTKYKRYKLTATESKVYYELIDRRKSYEREIWRLEDEIFKLENQNEQ